MDECIISRLIFLFTEIRRILIEHHCKDFLRRIEGILAVLYEEGCTVEEKIKEVKSIYKQFFGRYYSLDEWSAVLEDKEKEYQTNKYFEDILDEIWERLDLDLKHLPSVDEGYPPGHIYWKIIEQES